MNKQTEALKLAFEALEWQKAREALNAIKEALVEPNQALDKFFEVENELGLHYDEKPEQKPVVGKKTWFEDGKVVTQYLTAKDIYKEPEQEPEQEPVAWGYRSKDGEIYDCISPETHADAEGDYKVPLYTNPPKREWVGLTDEEITELRLKTFDARATNYEAYRVIEAKLKEKNT